MRRNALSSVLITSSSINNESSHLQQMLSKGYGIKGGILMVLLLLASSVVFHQIFENYVPYDTFAFTGKRGDEKVFFLRSTQTIEKLGTFGIDKEGYLNRLKQVEKLLFQEGYVVKYIEEKGVAALPRDSVLFALDTISLSDKSVKDIENYVSEGGFLVFNYHFAYNSDDKFRDNEVIQRITGLKPPQNIDHILSKDGMFLVPRILSPITQNITPFAKRVELYTVDSLPVFISDEGLEPDLKLSNWTLSSPPIVKDGQEASPLNSEQAGAVWHGGYKKGNWVYFSFPSYSMFSVEESIPVFRAILGNTVEFASKPATLMSYPYIDVKKVVLVSQDTEYKFSSFKNFINAAEKYKIPVSAYCVSSLAEKEEYLPLMERASKSPYIEIGSHSHSHKKIIGTSRDNIRLEVKGSKSIIDRLTKQKVTGFRPPREEMDEVMVEELIDAGYSYVLEKNKGYLYPQEEYKGLYIIPRTATDDYQYLVSLEWSQDEIVQRMMFETEYITSLDGIYSLSVHTHLMAYKNNIEMLEKYFEYVQQNPKVTALTGKGLIERVKKRGKIVYDIKQTAKNFLIDVTNNNVEQIKELTFRVFWTKSIQIKNIRAEIRGVDVKYKNNRKERFTDITILKVNPLSSLKLIAKYSVK